MARAIYEDVFRTYGIQPILVDVGASGSPPDIWRNIAASSTYVGFDPDLRELHRDRAKGFNSSYVIPKAVTAERQRTITLRLTSSPYCSSALMPDIGSLRNYRMAALFDVKDVVEVPATTLMDTLSDLDLEGIDWVKLDTQGQDLRLFQSLAEDVKDRVLAVDMEPGLIDAYVGEDLFVDCHTSMMGSGFWLSDLSAFGSQRVKPEVLARLDPVDLDENVVERWGGNSPAWVEARYLRTVEHVEETDGSLEALLLLWVIAMETRHAPFALEVADSCTRHNAADLADELRAATFRIMRTRRLRTRIRSIATRKV